MNITEDSPRDCLTIELALVASSTIRGVSQVTDSRLDQLATVPAGEWLGSRADNGRAKLRKAYGSRMEAKNVGSPNGNPSNNCFAQ